MNHARRYLLGLMVLAAGGVAMHQFGRSLWVPVLNRFRDRRTVEDVIREFRPAVETRLATDFTSAKVDFPPSRITLVGLKAERILELWAGSNDSELKLIKTYPILAASGTAGPKLREGDRQVPEGTYRIESLNPNSSYHLSMKVDYPNEFDRDHARAEGRDNPGGDIFIHGKDLSIGCLAMGDPAIEELFVLAATVGLENVKVILAPHDLRPSQSLPAGDFPEWYPELYAQIRAAMPGSLHAESSR